MPPTLQTAPSRAPLYWLALGTFAIGTEGFMIAPLLPRMALDLGVSIAAAGQLVTAFALAYALSSPILTTLSAAVDRRRLLLLCMVAFTAANLIAWNASNYWALMFARILLAFSSGLYVPSANAVGSALVPPEKRGSALAIVNGGMSIAVAIGVPLGATIGAAGGWRLTFAGVALLSAAATIGLQYGLPKGFGQGLPIASLRQRLDVVRRPAVLLGLAVTTLWAMGAFAVYTYIASYAAGVLGMRGLQLSLVQFLWGSAAATGIYLGGRSADKLGATRALRLALAVLTISFLGLSAIAMFVPESSRTLLFTLTLVLWGTSAWGFIAPQQSRLIDIAGPHVASVALSLNASFMYMGISLGAALGALTLERGGPAFLGVTGAACEFAALGMLLLTSHRAAKTARRRRLDEHHYALQPIVQDRPNS